MVHRTSPETLSLLRLLLGVVGGMALLVAPSMAQVNIQKIGQDTGARIAGGATASSVDGAKEQVAAESKPAEGSTDEQPAAGGAKPTGGAAGTTSDGVDPVKDNYNVLDPIKRQEAANDPEVKAELTRIKTEQVLNFIKTLLNPHDDVRRITFDARPPWVSRAPRPNPFDPQIDREFNPWGKFAPPNELPPPYYPPAAILQSEGTREAFQDFLRTAKFAGTVMVDGERAAIIMFGRESARLRVGEEIQQKNYLIKVEEITSDTVQVRSDRGDVALLTLDFGSATLEAGEGEHGLVIVTRERTE